MLGIVKQIGQQIAKPFIEEWHYSHRTPTGKNVFFGWFVDGELYAVANYGIGVNPYSSSYLSNITGLEINNGNIYELKRLCRAEPKIESFPLTAFLSICHRNLRSMDIRYVVSYSDPGYGHSGGIYRAANFIHLGVTGAEFHVVDTNGEIRHRRYAFRYARRNNITIQEARSILGLRRVKTVPKERWLLPLNRKDRKLMMHKLAQRGGDAHVSGR